MSAVSSSKTNHTESAARLPISHFILRKKKWLLILVAIGTCVLIANLMLHFLAREIITQHLESLGARNPNIHSLSWSILRSNVVIKGISWEQSITSKPSSTIKPAFYLKSARLNWRWNTLLRKQIIIDNLTIQQLHTRADLSGSTSDLLRNSKFAGLDFSSFNKKESNKKSDNQAWPILIHRLSIQDMRLAVHQPKKQLTNLKLSLLAKHLTTSPNQSAFIVADLSVNNSIIHIRGHSQNPSRANKNSELSLAFDNLPISLVQLWLPANHVVEGKLGADLKMEWVTANSSLIIKGSWFLKDSHYQQFNLAAKADLDWNGAVKFYFDKKFKLSSIQHQGTLASKKIHIIQAESDIDYFAENLQVHLDSGWKKTADTLNLDFKPTTKFSVNNLKISSKNITDSESISLKQLNLAWQGNTTDQIILTNAHIQALKILDPQTSGIFLNARLDTAVWAAKDNHLKIGNIVLDEVELGLRRTAENTVEPITTLNQLSQVFIHLFAQELTDNNSSNSQISNSIPQKSSPANSLLWEIESIALSEHVHTVHWQDDFVDKPVKMNISLMKAHIESIGLDQPSPWEIHWQIPPANGKANGLYFVKNNHWQAESTLKNFNLVPISSYITQATGYGIDSGSTNISTELKADPHLHGKIKLKLKSLDLSTVNKRRASAFSKDLTMPLDLALSTLRNKKGDINFTVPIKIKNDASNVAVIPIINQALTRALRNAALSYLKYSLQPYGSILFLAEKANSAATALQLGAVEFEPGSSTLSDNSTKLLSRVAKMMRNRPNLRIKVCAITTKADENYFRTLPPSKPDQFSKTDPSKYTSSNLSTLPINTDADSKILASSLETLAEQRKANVQNRLMEKSDFASRIFDCRVKRSTSKKPARVEIQLTNS